MFAVLKWHKYTHTHIIIIIFLSYKLQCGKNFPKLRLLKYKQIVKWVIAGMWYLPCKDGSKVTLALGGFLLTKTNMLGYHTQFEQLEPPIFIIFE